MRDVLKRNFFIPMAVCFLSLSWNAWSLNDTIARTPPMGWNSWNLFGSNITEAKVKAVADAFVTSGLRDAGYKYIVVDDCWQNATRDGSGALVAQSSKFPSGMKSLGDYVHGKGLKFGMYTTANPVTCCFEAGSYTYETKDVQTFAGWGVDYLKYDWCGVQSGEDATNITAQQIIARYVTMRNSLKSTNRPIVFAICEKGQKSNIVPGTWSDTVGHLWRIGGDIGANWSSITSIIDANASLNIYAGPSKGWNDPDMLEVGNGSLTENENRAHFSMWCIMAAPLILGNDPSTMPVAIKSIVTNKDAIAINQDSLGFQGVRIRKTGEQEVWVKPLMNGDKAVALFNRATSTVTMTVNWTDSLIKWSTTTKVKVSNVWAQKDSSNVTNSFSSSVASRAVVLLRLQNILTTNSSHSANRVTHDPLDAVRIIKVPDGITVDIPHVNEAVKVDLLDARGRLLYSFISYGGNQKVPGNRLTTGVIIVRVSFQMHNSVGVSIFCVPAETAALVPAVRRQ
jgi:alpha-galactosidase